MKAELLCLGNELLIGRTVNTNATEISRELTKLGFTFSHHLVVEDDKSTILDALKWIEKRSPDLLVITGGLGPTFDDIQMDCVAEFIGQPLVFSEEAMALIHESHNDNLVNDSRMKMATIPSGSIPLKNNVGTAPGVISKFGNMTIASLPGVPKEMKSIFYNEMIPYFKQNFETHQISELGFSAYGIGESKIIEFTEKIRERYPDCYFKSHPHKDDGKLWLSFHVYGYVDKAVVHEAISEWRQEVQKLTSDVTEIGEVFTEEFKGE